MGFTQQIINNVIEAVRAGESEIMVVTHQARYANSLLRITMRSLCCAGMSNFHSTMNSIKNERSTIRFEPIANVERATIGWAGLIFWDDPIWDIDGGGAIYDRVMTRHKLNQIKSK